MPSGATGLGCLAGWSSRFLQQQDREEKEHHPQCTEEGNLFRSRSPRVFHLCHGLIEPARLERSRSSLSSGLAFGEDDSR